MNRKQNTLIVAAAIAIASQAMADFNVSITESGTTVNMIASPPTNWVASGTGASISDDTLRAQLDAGNDVVVNTGPGGSEPGNVELSSFAGDFSLFGSTVGGQTLTFNAGGDLTSASSGFNVALFSPTGPNSARNLNLNADGHVSVVRFLSSASSSSFVVNAGDITINAAQLTTTTESDIRGVSTGGGSGGSFSATTTGDISIGEIWANVSGDGADTGGTVFLQSSNGSIIVNPSSSTIGKIDTYGRTSVGTAGDGGNVTLIARNGIDMDAIQAGSTHSVLGLTTGRGGDVTLESSHGSIAVHHSTFITGISTISSASGAGAVAGDAGNVTVTAADDILLSGVNSYSQGDVSGGNGGDVSLTANTGGITLNFPVNSYSARGAGGDITLDAGTTVNAASLSAQGRTSGGTIQVDAGGDMTVGFSYTSATAGAGGNVTLTAGGALVSGGANTVGTGGSSGNYTMSAAGDITVDTATSVSGTVLAGHITATTPGKFATGGGITFFADGPGGSINITADEIDLPTFALTVSPVVNLKSHTLSRPIELAGTTPNNPAALSLRASDLNSVSASTTGATAVNLGQSSGTADMTFIDNWNNTQNATFTTTFLQPVKNDFVLTTSAGKYVFDDGLSGAGGQMNGSAKVNGTMSPGHPLAAGTYGFNGVAIDFTNATLDIEIGGTSLPLHDQISVQNGSIDVTNAILDVSMLGAFNPTAGDAFTIVNIFGNATRTGLFATFAEGATVGTFGGTPLNITYAGGDGNDIVLYAPQGPVERFGDLLIIKFLDANGNGVQDGGETTLPGWEFLVTGPTGPLPSVFTGLDGTVLLEDLPLGSYTVSEVLQSGWYATTPNPRTLDLVEAEVTVARFGNNVPEPASLSLLVMVGTALLRRRR